MPFIHLLDCPHGNWWFLVWHRGYLGWFEKTCRELSKDQDFALPYWDWTADPRIPASFFEGVLDPLNPAYYITDAGELEKRFTDPVRSFWKSLSDEQVKQLALRTYTSVDELLSSLIQTFRMFAHSRTPTPAKPGFDPRTKTAVSPSIIHAALVPRTFLDFASDKTDHHSQQGIYHILEDQPHDNVHRNVGGFMGGASLADRSPLFRASRKYRPVVGSLDP